MNTSKYLLPGSIKYGLKFELNKLSMLPNWNSGKKILNLMSVL